MDEILKISITKYHPLHDIDFSKIDKKQILDRGESKKIKLLSYNIFLRPPPIKNNENDWKDERLYDFLLELKDFDVVCLQEMFGTLSTRRQTLIKIASKLGFFYFYEIPPPSFFSKNIIDGGLLILSRFPVVDTEFRPYTYAILDCIFGQKGCLFVKIRVNDSCLVIINTHLQASYFGTSQEDWDLTVDARLDQVSEINEFIIEQYNEGRIGYNDRVILLGDFNVDASNFKKKIEKKQDSHKPTFGVNSEGYDSVLTAKSDINSHQTLDYIFEVFLDKSDENLQNENVKLNFKQLIEKIKN